MTTAAAPAGLAAGSVFGIAALSPFGLNLETVAAASFIACLGVSGRFAFDWQNNIQEGKKNNLGLALQWLGAGLLGAPFVSILWLEMLKSIGATSDATTLIGLIFLGFVGPKGVSGLIGWAGSIANRVVPKAAQAPAIPPEVKEP